jgi:short-subunit dehydrogenase
MSPHEFTEVTYLGCVHGTMAALKSTSRRSHIIQIGSALAYCGIPLQSAYCGAKHAIRGFTDSLCAELIQESSGIRITMINLPTVNTPQFDWARVHLNRNPRPMGRPSNPRSSPTRGSGPWAAIGANTGSECHLADDPQ